MSHTKGPWTVKNESSDGLIIVRDTEGYGVAELYTQHNSEVERANATLIASAPELLEALESCVENYMINRTHEPDFIIRAKEAIAKAKL